MTRIGGQWRIEREILTQAHKDHARSAVADGIAWLAVMNGLGASVKAPYAVTPLASMFCMATTCEPARVALTARNASALKMIVMDIFARPDAPSFFNPQTECDALLQSMRALHAAVIAANATKTEAMTLIDRVIGKCPEP